MDLWVDSVRLNPREGHSGTEWLPTAKLERSRSGERQNLGAVNSFEGRKWGLQTKNLMRIVSCRMCLFSFYFVKYVIFIA